MNGEETNKINRIAEISHLNLLLGAGASAPFILPLPRIEKKMNDAEESGNTREAVRLKKDFFSKVMLPCLEIKSYPQSKKTKNKKIITTYGNYKLFLVEATKYLLARKSTLLNKQVNLFTTNIDIFLEKTLEDMGAYYNDGFIGHLKPSFRTSHFQAIARKKSEYAEQQSEIPTFNLYKLHGSLTWELDDTEKKIVYSDLSVLEKMRGLEGNDFDNKYSRLQIVNPNRKKFEISVLESTFYELLRLYVTELEKENVLLIVVGFSFSDEHILDITKRSMDSNPTLTVCIFSHTQKQLEDYKKKFEGVRYSNNLHIIPGPKGKNIDLKWVAQNFISKLDRSNRSETYARRAK